MADSDASLYDLRYNQVNQKLEAAGGTPVWNAVELTNVTPDSGITQLTGDVTAGPGDGSQPATIAALAVTAAKLAANSVTPAKISNTATDDFSFPRDITLGRNLITTTQPCVIKPVADAQQAIQIKQADGTQFLTFDTQNRRLGILTITPSKTFEVNGEAKINGGLLGVNPIVIGGTVAAVSACIDCQTTTQGVLDPKVTAVQRDAIASPVNGLRVYNTDQASFNYHNGTTWLSVPPLLSKVARTAQAADISPTTLFIAPATGLYEISIYGVTTAPDAGANMDAHIVVDWTDDFGTQTFNPCDLNLTSAVGQFTNATLPFEVTSGSTVSYSVTNGGTYGTARYSLYISVVRIN